MDFAGWKGAFTVVNTEESEDAGALVFSGLGESLLAS